MLNLFYVQEVDQAAALFQPLRIQLLKLMAEPKTCHDMAKVVGESPQKVYYHVKILEKAGLITKISEQRVRGIMQGIYQATARSYWLSPQMVGRLGGKKRVNDQMSLGYLLSLAETLQDDVAELGQQDEDTEIPSLGLSAQIELRDANERAAFAQDVQTMFQTLAEKYGKQAGDSPATETEALYKLMLACYPKSS